ncbi:zf-Tim10_DDP domain-containing protein [Meloidogyne graminicola]|uniref:Mitochondrial import inner membrane translocase subunit n=1 Tax=Meloidogyne graminicola TaxID=189291 RepID=A0A8S9ZEN3_9BILA|nr:zf-Tim10_DDP domain-containing protein [Meloidogyne graminicola]
MESSDPKLARFVQELQQEGERQKFQEQVMTICSKCFDVCAPDRPPNKMDAKLETCVVNCVYRMADATEYLAKCLEQKIRSHSSGNGGGFS